MKLAILAMFVAPIAFAQPDIVTSPVDHLYIPEGFDSNDAVEVIVTGEFSNPCFSRNNVEVKIQDDLIDIKVTAIAPQSFLLGSRACPDMIVPFKEVVTLGNLQGGEYQIKVNKGSQYAIQDQLVIAESSSSAMDDHVYAAVEWVERKSANSFKLHGMRYSSCFELDKVEVISNKKDTLSVLPVMKKVSDFCPRKGMPVVYDVKLDFSSLKSSKSLLHVRTMDGKSINSIVSVEE